MNRSMNTTLTARQTQILKSLVDEYIESADPVGSEVLEKKYNLGVSSATVRNEMVNLTKSGYLRQPHTSAGRVPTPMAMKFYINQLMEEKQMSLTDEVKAKEEVWDVRQDLDRLLEEATHSLAARTGSLAISALDSGKSWRAGLANVFSNPEFMDLNMCAGLFSFLDEEEFLIDLFFSKFLGESPIEVMFGEELGINDLGPVGIVATRFRARDKNGALGIIGPTRLRYPTIIPVLRYYKNMIEEIAR